MRKAGFAVLTVALAASLACQSTTIVGLTPGDETAIRRLITAEMNAASAADAKAWAALYTEDAIVLPPHGTALQGRDAIEGWLAKLPAISSAKGEAWR